MFLAKMLLNTSANACILSCVEMDWGMDLPSAFIYAVFSSSFPFLSAYFYIFKAMFSNHQYSGTLLVVTTTDATATTIRTPYLYYY